MAGSDIVKRNTHIELSGEEPHLTVVAPPMWSGLRGDILKIEEESFCSALADSEEGLFAVVNSATGIFLALTVPSPHRVIGYIAGDLLENFSGIAGITSDSHFEMRDTIYLASVAILPSWQRRGLATSLMRECMRIASERGIGRATAHIESGSVGRIGLQITVLGSFENWYGTGRTFDYVEILMEAQL